MTYILEPVVVVMKPEVAPVRQISGFTIKLEANIK